MMLNNHAAPPPVLYTERLKLRPLAITDEQQVFTLRTDPAINRYLSRPGRTTVEDARQFIINMLEHKAHYWAITQVDSDLLIGTICLFNFSDDRRRCEIGYELLTPFQGHGVMQEAAATVIQYAFCTLQVRHIEAYFHHDNLRSAHLLEKLSFRMSTGIPANDAELQCYCLTNPGTVSAL